MWRTIKMTDIHMLHYGSSTLSKICRYAVDESCGRLEDIFINYFGTDDLLKYVADRYSKYFVCFQCFNVIFFLILFCC
jgi:hypothetical protein